MEHTMYLQASGPDADAAVAKLTAFLGDHGIQLQESQLPMAALAGRKSRGEEQETGKTYTFAKEARDWTAWAATVGALLIPMVMSSPQDQADYIDLVPAVSELLQEIGDIQQDMDFTLEIVDPQSGLSVKLDKRATPAKIIEFCKQSAPQE